MSSFILRFKKFFSENWMLKLISIVLATLGFYAIRGATSFEAPYVIPLKVEVESDVAILDQNPSTVKVVFRGSQEDLKKLDQKRILAVVSPKVSGPGGSENISITPGDITGYPGGISIAGIRPEVARITFDRAIEKTFRVNMPEKHGLPLRGKVEIDYKPKTVRIKGSQRRLEELFNSGHDVVDTEPVDVDGVVESFTTRLKVLPPADTWVSRIDPDEISAKVNIVTETVNMELTNMVVLAILESSSKEEISFEPEFVTVLLNGRADVIDGITRNSVKVFADCVGLEAGSSYELPIRVNLPAGKEVQSTIKPDTVKVTITKNDDT